MNLFQNTLSGLQPGTQVRIQQKNGQTLEGTVVQNDGTQALALQISSYAVIAYEQIGSVEMQFSAAHPVITPQSPVTTQTSAATPITVPELPKQEEKATLRTAAPVLPGKEELLGFTYDLDTLDASFKALSNSIQSLLKRFYGRCQSAYTSGNWEKLDETAEKLWSEIRLHELENDAKVNCFAANVMALAGDHHGASDAFYYSGDVRTAYLSAYNFAYLGEDSEAYQDAVIFSGIYLGWSKQKEFLPEAASVLLQSTLKTKDLTGIRHALQQNLSPDANALLSEVIKRISGKSKAGIADFTDLSACLKKLESYCPETGAAEQLQTLLQDCPPENLPEQKTEPSATTESPAEDPNQVRWGVITKFNYFEHTGTIQETEGGKLYQFSLDTVTDEVLRNRLKKVTSLADFKTLNPGVTFKAGRAYGKDTALSVSRSYIAEETKKTPAKSKNKTAPEPLKPEKIFSMAESQLSTKHYEKAVELFSSCLDSAEAETAFSGVIRTYLAMWNVYGDLGYTQKTRELLEQYGNKVNRTVGVLTALIKLYQKLEMYPECLAAIDSYIAQAQPKPNKLLPMLQLKAECCQALNDREAAAALLKEWIRLVDENSISKFYGQRAAIHADLADLYLHLENWEQCAYHASVAAEGEKKQRVLDALALHGMTLNTPAAAEEEPEETEEESAEETDDTEALQNALNAFQDKYTLSDLHLSGAEILERAEALQPLYCMLTYLSAAAMIEERENKSQLLRTAYQAYSYAFDHPIAHCEYLSAQITGVYYAAQEQLGEKNDYLFSAAALRALFLYSGRFDYELDNMMQFLDGKSENSGILSSVQRTADLLMQFQKSTGNGIDRFADYRQSAFSLKDILQEAADCIRAADERVKVFETNGRVRYIRRLMFIEDSEIRRCIAIAANNAEEQLGEVRQMLEDLFIREGRAIAIENIDNMKLDAYVNRYWETAAVRMKQDNLLVSRPHEALMEPKRHTITQPLKRILSCLCSWVNAAEQNAGTADNEQNQAKYIFTRGKLLGELSALKNKCQETLKEQGFSWALESLLYTAGELMDKLDGSYDVRRRKYLFMDFLRSDEVLLNDQYLPELESTFCGLHDFNILTRIERHAAQQLPELDDRLEEIFANDLTRNNFRSARLIRDYARDMQLEELAGYEKLLMLEPCIAQGHNRIRLLHSDFRNDLELAESYGRLSNVTGKKDAILACAQAWYDISQITCDFGFYTRILDTFRRNIEENAQERGKRLLHRLELLHDSPELDFGVYTREEIESFIQAQNFTVAEIMMNDIQGGDTGEVPDYAQEPIGYLENFLDEYSKNFPIVSAGGYTLENAILRHEGRREGELERVMLDLSDSGRKDVRGGCSLIKNWMVRNPTGTERITRLLTGLGISGCQVTEDTSCPQEDSYCVRREKHVGKVNYPHPIPAFSSAAEQDSFRVLCLYGKFDSRRLMDKFREVNAAPMHTIVLLDSALNAVERRQLARAAKQERSFARTFIVVDRVALFWLARHYAANTVSRMLMAITLPFAYYQPFVPESNVQTPPEMFTGRQSELSSIEDAGGANLVYGGRQLGKSALLKMAANNVDGNALGDRAIVVDIVKLNYTEAARKVSRHLILKGILDESCECDDWEVLALHIRKRLSEDAPERKIHYLLLLLDEADDFIRSCQEVGYKPISELKNLQTEGNFKAVMAGLHNLSRFERQATLYNDSILAHMTSVVVRPFRRLEATELLTNTLAYLGFRFHNKDRIISLILAKTNYFPGLIQLYCQKLLESMKNKDYAGYSETTSPPYEVTVSHFKQILSDKDFTAEINKKLEMTLFVDHEQGSYYHIISLVLAHLYYSERTVGDAEEEGHTIADIFQAAQEYHITRLCSLDEMQMQELLGEMWDLNILSARAGRYMFSTESFRELLGSEADVQDALVEYIG